MKEKSLLFFTLLAQAAVGVSWTSAVLYLLAAAGALPPAVAMLLTAAWQLAAGLIAAALLASFFHLGAPLAAWRAIRSFSTSWLSREIVFALLFAFGAWMIAYLQLTGRFRLPLSLIALLLTAAAGLALIYSMAHAYRLRTVPAWDTGITTASFFTTAVLLGALMSTAMLLVSIPSGPIRDPLLRGLALWTALLLAVQLALLPRWLGQLSGSEAAQASFERLTQANGPVLRMRSLLAFMAIVILAIGLLFGGERSTLIVDLGLCLAIGLALISEMLGRILFYAARVRHGI